MKKVQLLEGMETRRQVSLRKESKRVVSIVHEMEEVGPDVAEISRRLRLPVESVRYVIKTLLKKGYGIQMLPNLTAVGLKRVVIIADIADEYIDEVERIILKMEKWYLKYIMKTIPEERFIMQFAVPETAVKEFSRFVERMKEIGFLSKVYSNLSYDWTRFARMRAEYFDFKRGRWNFDWSQTLIDRETEPITESRSRKVDQVDLGILIALDEDATRKLTEVAKILKVSTKTVLRHYRHVQKRRLHAGYIFVYTKTQVKPETKTLGKTTHRFLAYEVRVDGISPHELAELSRSLNRLPFLWAEEGGENYAAELVVPLDLVNETMEYVRKALRPFRGRSATYLEDPSGSIVFTVPQPGLLFDRKKKQWTFDVDAQIDALKEVLRSKPVPSSA